MSFFPFLFSLKRKTSSTLLSISFVSLDRSIEHSLFSFN